MLFCLLLSLAVVPLARAENRPAEPVELNWHDDYGTAFHAARNCGRMLLIHFEDTADERSLREFQTTLANSDIQELCHKFELLCLPTTYEVTIDGKTTPLLTHAAFAAMGRNAGLAIVDLQDPDCEHFGKTVSAVPFGNHCYYAPKFTSEKAVRALLQLPAGSLTQRSMIFAVRLHPDNPASTGGRADEYLLSEAAGHSAYQARIGVQGHQGFDARFQRINARIGGSAAQEVVAESWPGETMLKACFSCVKSWRGSPGHWSAVSSQQSNYAYDIHRGSNGIWYATGLFAG